MSTFDEGSVEVDTGAIPDSSNQQDQASSSQVSGEEEKKEQSSLSEADKQAQNEESTLKKDAVEYTEKGTKKDPNPLSAAYQELANTRRLLSQYEQVLKDPNLLARYAKEMGLTVSQAREELKDAKKATEDALFSAESFETADDIANAMNRLYQDFIGKTKAYEETIQDLRQQISLLSEGRRYEAIAQSVEQDIAKIRSKYPELDPKLDKDGNPTNPDYNPDLERIIAEFYTKIDQDPSTGMFRGSVSLAEVADYFMQTQQVGKKAGVKQAQTAVIEKRMGKVTTSQKPVSATTESEEDSIATRIAKAFKS